jgi:hypothetical protein
MNLIIKGGAGQGIQFMSFVLANVLKDNSYNVSLISEYSPLMRSGDSVAKLVFSKDKIDNPIVEEAELEYDLRDEKYKEIKVLNMFLVGEILKKLEISIKNIKNYLPDRNKEENLEEIKKGYEN